MGRRKHGGPEEWKRQEGTREGPSCEGLRQTLLAVKVEEGAACRGTWMLPRRQTHP